MSDPTNRQERLKQARNGVLTLDTNTLSADFFSLVEDFDDAVAALIDADEALTQVIVDINDPHPRTVTLAGYRACMEASERGIVESRTKLREILKKVGVNLREEGIIE